MNKQITRSSLHSCKLDIDQLNHVIEQSNEHVRKLVIEMVGSVLYGTSEIELAHQQQFVLNTLADYGIVEYLDDNNVPCENSDDLFGTSTSRRKRLKPKLKRYDDPAPDIDGLFAMNEPYHNNDDDDLPF